MNRKKIQTIKYIEIGKSNWIMEKKKEKIVRSGKKILFVTEINKYIIKIHQHIHINIIICDTCVCTKYESHTIAEQQFKVY